METNVDLAKTVVQALVDGDSDAARKKFGSTMQRALGKERLEAVWIQYARSKGVFLRPQVSVLCIVI